MKQCINIDCEFYKRHEPCFFMVQSVIKSEICCREYKCEEGKTICQ